MNILQKKLHFVIIIYLKWGWKTITLLLINKCFDQSVRHNKETYEEIIEIANGNDFLSGGLLGYSHFNKHNRLIAMDLDLRKQ